MYAQCMYFFVPVFPGSIIFIHGTGYLHNYLPVVVLFIHIMNGNAALGFFIGNNRFMTKWPYLCLRKQVIVPGECL